MAWWRSYPQAILDFGELVGLAGEIQTEKAFGVDLQELRALGDVADPRRIVGDRDAQRHVEYRNLGFLDRATGQRQQETTEDEGSRCSPPPRTRPYSWGADNERS